MVDAFAVMLQDKKADGQTDRQVPVFFRWVPDRQTGFGGSRQHDAEGQVCQIRCVTKLICPVKPNTCFKELWQIKQGSVLVGRGRRSFHSVTQGRSKNGDRSLGASHLVRRQKGQVHSAAPPLDPNLWPSFGPAGCIFANGWLGKGLSGALDRAFSPRQMGRENRLFGKLIVYNLSCFTHKI